MTSGRARVVAVLFCLALATGTAGADIVYQNYSPTSPGVFIVSDPDEMDSTVELPGPVTAREFDSRIGDDITLTGTSRFVTQFDVRVWAISGLSVPPGWHTDVQLTLYQNVGGLPGTALWTGTALNVSQPALSFVEVRFTPNITVSNSLIFAMAFSNTVPGAAFGPTSSASSPSIGTSALGALAQDTASQQWRIVDYGSNFRGVQARVTAVPTPGTLAVFVVACLSTRRQR
jgi:hypothetical protein